ncbi:MAG: GNAT family N-acetyltransferase [Bacteroidales bacterium]|nr:GNAT family N-acetyltransferase [Bacteroidales bacterium]
MLDIKKGTSTDIKDCIESLYASVLTTSYFLSEDYTREWVLEGLERNEIFMAQKDGSVIGFMRIDFQGAFAKFPLLRVIAIKDNHRNRGLGREMLKYFEDISFKDYDKVFLLVSEFNSNAKRLYSRLNYLEVGCIPGLYKKEYSEFLMMKTR